MALGGHKMVVKSNVGNATQVATRRLEKVIESHRTYFSEWRSDRFDRSLNEGVGEVQMKTPKKNIKK